MSSSEIIDLFKKNRILLVIIMFSFVVLLGSSYAWYSVSIASDKAHTIKAGTMELLLQNHNENITLEKAIPQTDEEAEKNASYDFSVTNTGSINSRYSIYLEDTELSSATSRIGDNFLKYNLDLGDTPSSSGYLSALNNVSGKRKLVSGELEPNESVTYKLRIWIAEEATSEIAGEEFVAKLSIEGAQTNMKVEE